MSLQRNFRLKRSIDFQRVRQSGKSYAHPLVVLIIIPNQLAFSRFGVVASRVVGNAVKRNRAKRLLHAAVQGHLSELSPGWDILLIARHSLLDASFSQIQISLATLLRRANLLQEIHD